MAVFKIKRSVGSGVTTWASITGKPIKQSIILTSNIISSSSALSDIADWSFAVTADKKYKIQIIATHQTAATTTGLKLAVYLSSGTGSINGYFEGGISSAAVATELKIPITAIGLSNSVGSFIITTGVSAINNKHYVGGNLVFNCVTSGIFKFQLASEINLSAVQLNLGSTIIIEEI